MSFVTFRQRGSNQTQSGGREGDQPVQQPTQILGVGGGCGCGRRWGGCRYIIHMHTYISMVDGRVMSGGMSGGMSE